MELSDLVKSKLLPLTRLLVEDALRDTELLKFDKHDPQQLYSVCIYGSIIEIAHGCIALLDVKQITALPILLRSFLEAYADFRACVEDDRYYKNMYAAFINERLRLLKHTGKNHLNPYLAGMLREHNIDTEKEALEAEIRACKKENRGPLGNRERFEKGKLEFEFQSIYWLLCLHGHNNLSALEDRHIEKQGEDHNVVLFKEEASSGLVRYLDMLIAILIDSTERIHKLLGSTTGLSYKQHKELFEAARISYSIK